MSTLTTNIKNILIQLAVSDKLPMDMTQLDESIFDEVLSEQNLREGLTELGCNTELVINSGWVDDAIRFLKERTGKNYIMTDEEKVECVMGINFTDIDSSITYNIMEEIENSYEYEEDLD